MSSKPRLPRHDLAVLLGVLVLLLFASPLAPWWASTQLPWFAPYALWALVIALAAWAARKDRHEP